MKCHYATVNDNDQLETLSGQKLSQPKAKDVSSLAQIKRHLLAKTLAELPAVSKYHEFV
jgi:hypothetical protein